MIDFKDIMDLTIINNLQSMDAINSSSAIIHQLQMVNTSTIVGLKLQDISLEDMRLHLKNLSSMNGLKTTDNSKARGYFRKIKSLRRTSRILPVSDDDFF